jgi:hypothetical protein
VKVFAFVAVVAAAAAACGGVEYEEGFNEDGPAVAVLEGCCVPPLL